MKEESKNKKEDTPLRVVEFNQIGVNVPQYKESINPRGGFINFGDNNDMPNYYISLLDRSPKHNAIVNQKASMISGNGWKKGEMSNEGLSFIANKTNEYDLDEIAARVGYDLEVFGAFVLNIIWSKDRSKIAEINYMTPQSLRIVAPDNDQPNESSYMISKDWTNINKPENKPVVYPAFSVVDRSGASQILYVKTYQAGKYWYGVPEYISGSRWIEMEYEISQFHLSNIRNGFAPSMFINFPTGIPTDEEMMYNDKKLMRQLAGPKGGGKAFITYSEGAEQAPSITPIDSNDNDKKFIDLNEIITEGILSSHRVSDPSLFGLEKPSQGITLGQTQILNSLEIFRAQYIAPKQKFIEKVFTRLARVNGISDEIKLNDYELNLAKIDLAISDVLSILTSQLPSSAKKNLLILNGYTEEDAEKIVVETPPAPPAPTQPKIN